MGIYTESIRKKEENNINLEKYADDSLIHDKKMQRIESEIDDVQTALFYILEKFNVTIPRQFGHRNVGSLLDCTLDPLGMMYDYSESVEMAAKNKTEYILAFREDGHAVAITPSYAGYRWFCPHDQKGGLATKKYCRTLRKECYVLNRPIEERSTIITTFIANVLKYLTVYDIIRLIIASLAVVLLGLIIPRINRWIYDVFIHESTTRMAGFRFAVFVFFNVSLVRCIISMLKNLYLSKIKIRISIKIQSAIMAKVLHLPQTFFRKNSSGKLSKRINSCGRLSDMILSIFMGVLLDVSFSLIYLFQLRNLAPELYKPALIFITLKVLLSIVGSYLNAVNEAKNLEVDMENGSLLYSSIRGIQKIKGMGAEKAVYSKWAENYRKTLQYNYKQPFFLKYQNALISAVTIATTITLMGLASFRGLTREDYMTFTSSYALILIAITSLTDMLQNLFLMKTYTDNVSPIFKAENEQSQILEYVKNISGNIRIEHVSFKYPESQKGCLKDVNLEIKRGEKLAIVGESGCGKSTLLKLLIGFETPDEGNIYYDNKAINTLNLKSLRRRIGSVFQFSKVFPGTIESNVTFTSNDIVDEKKVWEAVDKAAIGDYIRTLPLKLDTEISQSNSSGFSGGQRQRILLARAFYTNPNVYILDEATSALDNVTQNQVLESINNLKATVIMVAHRLSTVVGFDRIIMFENGKIVEEGNYEELMAKDGKFAGLVKKQLVEKQ